MNSSANRFFLAFALAGALVVGCGGGDETSTTTSTTLSEGDISELAGPATVNITGRVGDEKQGGTGILYSTDAGARVLTNDHVVAGTTALSAEVDGVKYSARIIGEAPCQDVAVLELVNPPSDLATIPLGESADLQAADSVVALGYPITAGGSKDLTTTTGEVSNPEVVGDQISVDLPQYPALIQHTATVNPGNSGGPLLDEQGEVIGMNTLSSAGSDTVEGQSYAISIDHIRPLLESLEAGTDQVNLGWNIVAGDGPTAVEFLGARYASLYNNSVMVLGVTNGLPADDAEPDAVTTLDRILEINGSSVSNVPQVCKILESALPGDTLEIEEEYLSDDGFVPYTLEIKIPEEQEAMTSTPTTDTTTDTTTATP